MGRRSLEKRRRRLETATAATQAGPVPPENRRRLLIVPVHAPKRVTRGGSFLCNVDYCLSYRPSVRRGMDPYNPMSHLGFRLVMSTEEWERKK